MIDVEENAQNVSDERMLSPECLQPHHFQSIARRNQTFENERYDHAMHAYEKQIKITFSACHRPYLSYVQTS